MFDNVRLRVDNLPESYNLSDYVKIKYIRNDGSNYMCQLENLEIWQNRNYLTILGSLAKYLHGENITPLKRKDVKQAIKKTGKRYWSQLKKCCCLLCRIWYKR